MILLAVALTAGCWEAGSGLRVSGQHASYHQIGGWTQAGARDLREPFGIAVDQRTGNVFVTDARNSRVVVFDPGGSFRREFGSRGDGPGEFEKPTGVAVAPDASVYVADYDLDRVQKFSAEGEFVLQWGNSGKGAEQLRSPNGLAVDSAGNVYVADFYNKRIKVFDGGGRFQRTIGRPGQWRGGALDYPTDVDVLPGGRVLVADAYNYRLQLFSADGKPLAAWGWHLFWLWPRPAGGRRGFNVPIGVAAGPQGRFLHVADSANHRIVMLDGEGRFVSEWKITGRKGAYNTPVTIAVSPGGRQVYATDIANHRVLVLEVRND